MSATTDSRFEECQQLLAEAQYQQAMPLADRLVATKDGTQLIEALYLQAQSRRGGGHYGEAIQALCQRRKVAHELGDATAQAWSLINLGRLYLLLNRYELALESLTEAIRLPSTLQADIALLSALADVYAQVGALGHAEWLCDQALMLLQDAFNSGHLAWGADATQSMAERRLAVARLAEAQGQYQRALYVLEGIEIDATYLIPYDVPDQALLIRQNATALAPLVDMLAGRAHLNLGELQNAEERLAQARDTAQQRGDVAIEVEATAELGRIRLQEGNLAEAVAQLAAAVDQAERWLTYFEVEEFRSGLRRRLAKTYADLVVVAARAGNGELSWQTIERARAREFLASLRTTKNTFQQIGPDTRRIEELTQRIGALSGRLLEVERGSSLFGRLREERKALLDEKVRYLQKLQRLPRRLALVDTAVVSSDRLAGFLGNDTAFVEYFFTPEQVLGVLIVDGSLHLIELKVHPNAVTRRVQRFLRVVGKFPSRSGDDSWRALASQLYNALWAPLMPHIGHKPRVCVVPHSALLELPFITLGADEPLLKQTEIVYAPSGSILTVVGNKPVLDLQRVGVFANPLPEGRWSLPSTEQEAKAIAQTSLEVTSRCGSEATLSSVINAARSVDVLHLACHAEFDPERPLLSALLLASEEGEPEKLEAHTIYGAEVTAKLVVLSACETGRFEHELTGELQGLVRAFMIAGASAVIGSQWIVDDPATARLMASLYEALAAEERPGAALRSAQLSVSSDPHYAHPYFWAAFGLYGNWR